MSCLQLQPSWFFLNPEGQFRGKDSLVQIKESGFLGLVLQEAENNVEANSGMKRMNSTGSGEVNVQKKELSMEMKPTNITPQKARANSSNKHDNTEPKPSDVKPNGKASASPTSEPSSPSKPDFIHVRARRGQATDSHSLAERVG